MYILQNQHLQMIGDIIKVIIHLFIYPANVSTAYQVAGNVLGLG